MDKIYISGKISGLDLNAVKFNFDSAERLFKNIGFEVANPTTLGLGGDDEWTKYLLKDIELLLDGCTHIFMMIGWESSKGAKIELAIAKELGLEIIYEKSNLYMNDRHINHKNYLVNQNIGDTNESDKFINYYSTLYGPTAN